MSDIQRWTFDGPPAYEYADGGYVTFADHVAAVAEAEQRGYNMAYPTWDNDEYRQGQRDAIAVLERLRDENRQGTDPEWGVLNAAIAAIKAVDNV
jgi:hypothetical protein